MNYRKTQICIGLQYKENTVEAVLKFNLDEEDDKHEFKLASHGKDLALALWDLDNNLRSRIKYSDKEEHTLQTVRNKLHEILDSYDVNLDGLVR